MLRMLEKAPLLMIFMLGVGCDEPVSDDRNETIVDQALLEEQLQELQTEVAESALCIESGVAVDDVLDVDSELPERRVAAEILQAHVTDMGADTLCEAAIPGELTLGNDDAVAACSYVNSGACTGCIGGY